MNFKVCKNLTSFLVEGIRILIVKFSIPKLSFPIGYIHWIIITIINQFKSLLNRFNNTDGETMTFQNKCLIIMYPGGGCIPIRPPEPRPVLKYGVIRPLYAAPVR